MFTVSQTNDLQPSPQSLLVGNNNCVKSPQVNIGPDPNATSSESRDYEICLNVARVGALTSLSIHGNVKVFKPKEITLI